MPEYPDIVVYLERLSAMLSGQVLRQVRLTSPFLLRTFEPRIESIFNRRIIGFERIGKRLVFVFDDELYLVVHLMITGRFHWRPNQCAIPVRIGLAAFDFAHGTLLLTEVSTQKRASLHLVRGRVNLQMFDAGGLDVMVASEGEFRERLTKENHTLKRALTDPRLFSGIGNAYSDEILHRAQLSPVQLTQRLSEQQISRLYQSTQATLQEWTERLRAEAGDSFPEKVTAFRDDMAVHGRFGQRCPVCGTAVQRIRYADNETNYCPTCQTDGKLLADRSLSRLLKRDWPKSLEELEAKFRS